MLICGQEIMRLKTYEKEATQNKHMKAETKQTRIWDYWVTASRTLEQVYVRMSSTCMHKLDHAYADPYLETLISTKTLHGTFSKHTETHEKNQKFTRK